MRVIRHMDKSRLDEQYSWKLSPTGKLFIAGIAAWLIGQKTRLKIRGTKEEIDALTNALIASRQFQHELKRPGATADSVLVKLGLKNASVREFEELTGIPFPD